MLRHFNGRTLVVLVAPLVILAIGAGRALASPPIPGSDPLGSPSPIHIHQLTGTATDTPTLTGTVTGTPPTATPWPPIITPTPTATPTISRVGCPPNWSEVTGLSGAVELNGVAAKFSDAQFAYSTVWVVGDDGQHTFAAKGRDENNNFEWYLDPPINVSSTGNYLKAVAAVTYNDVWAVGYYTGNGIPDQTLIEHSNGTSWSVVPSPSIASANSRLTGVAAVSPNDVWAVGYICNTGCSAAPYDGDGTLIEHWNGTLWSIVPSPSPGSGSLLNAVTVVSADDVWAVGYYRDEIAGGVLTLTMHWDGRQWSVVPSPNISVSSSPQNTLYSVSAVSGGDVWAAGSARFGLGHYRVLILHWDGALWNVVDAPSPGFLTNHIFGLVAVAANNVWAVGREEDFGVGAAALILHWDGGRWSQFVAPQGFNTLSAVTALTPNYIWTVGLDSSGNPVAGRYRDAFADVYPADYFYEPVEYLYCRGVVSGYRDGTFRPYSYTTRGQLSKIVVLAEGWSLLNPGTPTFNDVPAGSPFYQYVETAHSHGIISGYEDGTFRPNNNVTRGQLCKIVVIAQGWPLENPGSPTFTDVPAGSTFFRYIETAYAHYIISGYSDGTFRPGNNAARGQISKIVYNAITGH